MCSSSATTLPERRGRRRRRTGKGGRCSRFHFGSWNMRTLLNSDGPVETAAIGNCLVKEDQKINIVVRKACRFKLEVLGLQETKWFGSETYRVNGALVLSSGRPHPTENFQRGEGVGIILCGRAQRAFDAGEAQWSAVSSCLLLCKLKFLHPSAGQCPWVPFIVEYAPIFHSSRAVKEQFYSQLQQLISRVPSDHDLVVLVDFNARVGIPQRDIWGKVCGPHGVGLGNDAGQEFL